MTSCVLDFMVKHALQPAQANRGTNEQRAANTPEGRLKTFQTAKQQIFCNTSAHIIHTTLYVSQQFSIIRTHSATQPKP